MKKGVVAGAAPTPAPYLYSSTSIRTSRLALSTGDTPCPICLFFFIINISLCLLIYFGTNTYIMLAYKNIYIHGLNVMSSDYENNNKIVESVIKFNLSNLICHIP